MFYYYNFTPSLIHLRKIILFMSESKLIGARCYSMEDRGWCRLAHCFST